MMIENGSDYWNKTTEFPYRITFKLFMPDDSIFSMINVVEEMGGDGQWYVEWIDEHRIDHGSVYPVFCFQTQNSACLFRICFGGQLFSKHSGRKICPQRYKQTIYNYIDHPQ